MPLKLQAHVDSRIWSLQSTVSFFFLSSIWYSEVLFAFKLGLPRVYFFQNVRKMHFFPMSHQTRFAAPRSLMCTYSVCSEFLFCVADQVQCINGTNQKKTKKTKTTTTKQNNPPPPKKKKIKTTTTTKKQQKNSNKQITKTDKTQQTNVALATARAYKIYVTNVSVFLLFLFIVSSIWGKMVLKPYSGCHGFALIRLFFRGGFARSALLFNGCSLKS